MGLNKIRTRRQRRPRKHGAKPRHRLVGGRTGSLRHKQRAGMLAELAKR